MFRADCHHVDLLCTITRGYLLARDALCPFRYFRYVLLEHLAVGHSEEELGLYAVCRIIVDVGAVSKRSCKFAVTYGFEVSADNLFDRNIMTAFQDSCSNSGCVDGWRGGSYEEETDKEALFFSSMYEINFLVSGHDGLENHTMFVCEALFSLLLAILGSFQNGFLVVPVTKHVLGYIVGVDIE